MRSFSLLLRRWKSFKNNKKSIQQFKQHQQWINDNLSSKDQANGCLIVRLDDIGDYVLFRNTLPYYAQFYKNDPLYFVGNLAWKPIFEEFDNNLFVSVIWIDKSKYFGDDSYKRQIWKQINDLSVSTVVAPSVSRNLMLDDLCVLATKAKVSTAANMLYGTKQLIELSNNLYHHLIDYPEHVYEFDANIKILESITQTKNANARPYLSHLNLLDVAKAKYICCFIGANAISRRWSTSGWIKFIQSFSLDYPQYAIYLIGGSNDVAMGNDIINQVGISSFVSFVGKTSLVESISLIQNACLLVSNNSMAYHVAMSSDVPTVLITNGDNAYRFTTFDHDRFPNVEVIYPPRFAHYYNDYLAKRPLKFVPVKLDIQQIQATTVLDAVNKVLNNL